MFSFGGSKSSTRSKSQSQSTSSSFGNSDSFNQAASDSISGGSSVSGQQSQSGSRIAFEDVFARLFSGAEDTAANLDPSLLTQASNDLFSSGTRFLESIGGDQGSAFLADRLSNRDTLDQEQIGLLQEDIGQLFNEELLPGITSEAVAGGQLGGGRQGVAQGRAVDAATDAFARGSVDIRQRSQQQLDEIARGISERSLQGAQLGLGAGAGLFDLAQQGFGAELQGAELLAGIFGGPSVLTDSQSSGFSTSEDFARAFSDSFGASTSRSGSQSQSTATSKSRSKSASANLGFGGSG